MILTFHFIILKRVKNIELFVIINIFDNFFHNNLFSTVLEKLGILFYFKELICFQRIYIGVCLSNTPQFFISFRVKEIQ